MPALAAGSQLGARGQRYRRRRSRLRLADLAGHGRPAAGAGARREQWRV